MNRDRRNSNDRNEGNGGDNGGNGAGWWVAAVGVHWSRNSNEEHENNEMPHSSRSGAGNFSTSRPSNRGRSPSPSSDSSSGSDSRVHLQSGGRVKTIPRDSLPITNLNSLLQDIYVKYVAVKDDEFQYYYNEVFMNIFYRIHRTMQEFDDYYARYSRDVSFAGSHYDGLRIDKPDEFDMDIVIGMPVSFSELPFFPSMSDIIIKPQNAGYVELKMGAQFKNLPIRESWEINKTAYRWKDEDDFLLRSKFLDWFKSVVVRALNRYTKNGNKYPVCEIDGVEYTIRRTESGPAITLIIENIQRGFRMDIDLVPALRFPEARWPLNDDYREIPSSCKRGYWMVVPKPNRNDPWGGSLASRTWRVALQYQEGDYIYKRDNLKQALRLLKKLRDVQNMQEIASYYIKTLFFWEIERQELNKFFWRKSPAELFELMVQRLHTAVAVGSIPYFWNENNNLIGHIKRPVLDRYELILKNFLSVLQVPSKFKEVAKYLLTSLEYQEYRLDLDI